MLAADHLYFSLSYPSATPLFRRGHQAIATFVSQPDATPLPIDLGCSLAFYPPTGPVVVFPSVEELVSKALRYTNTLAMLPVSEEDEQTVEALIKRRLGALKVRPLQR